jgi:hypothetical protein
MTASFTTWDDRDFELALADAIVGVSDAERASLRGRLDPPALAALETSITALQLAHVGPLEAPPAGLMERLRADASVHAPTTPVPASAAPLARPAERRPFLFASAGWIAAAALLVGFLLRALPEDRPDPPARRATLVASARDLVRADWSGTDDPLASGVTGDVVWSTDRQEGYLRFRSLAANDPRANQYQLWIFDPTRADWEARPVDGGVFDVGTNGEVVVPIDAKLEVRESARFAITLEVPGGVVVSNRERLILTATPGE